MMDFKNGVENVNVMPMDSEKGSTSIVGVSIVELYDTHSFFIKIVFTNVRNETLYNEDIYKTMHSYILIHLFWTTERQIDRKLFNSI